MYFDMDQVVKAETFMNKVYESKDMVVTADDIDAIYEILDELAYNIKYARRKLCELNLDDEAWKKREEWENSYNR